MGKKAPYIPLEKTLERNPESKRRCPKCDGFGLVHFADAVPVSHNGTLGDVRRVLDRGASKLCACRNGAGWALLVDDAAKGDGVHKSKLGAGAGVGAGERKGKTL